MPEGAVWMLIYYLSKVDVNFGLIQTIFLLSSTVLSGAVVG